MPFIDTKLNIRLPEEKEEILKAKLGEAIATFPGKSEYWLMLNFTDNCRLWFRGYNRFPIAMVEIKLFGGEDTEASSKLTKIICDLFRDELGISPDHVYVKYEFTQNWGWNGENF